MNSVELIGRVGQDAVLRATQSGQPVLSFSMATSYKRKDKTEDTTWHDVVVWGRSAEMVAQKLKKGSKVYVKGRIAKRTFQGKSGENKTVTEIVATWIEPISAAGGGYTQGETGGSGAESDFGDVPF